MNRFRALNTDYITPSITIETILISSSSKQEILFVYNHKGNSFRLFKGVLDLIKFIKNNNSNDYTHFDSEEELDIYLANIDLDELRQ